ncbi:hypothetical protein [Pontiella sulfatireligans]|uniref:Uncharacterized protein n=1 Tax=Pontiella sulfatireligans TaxID=2750658 RepID=A0A6C2UKT1_9BACT|nr:hypothetical protein [Pontiella sulfatireligans]VGO20845.1 hypothetical protein SCARR_02912 [Pontiella sulfatireligans]
MGLRYWNHDNATNITESITNVLGSITNIMPAVTNIGTSHISIQASQDVYSNYHSMTNLSGAVASNIHLRAVYDLDSRGFPGSFEVYYSINNGPEILGYAGGKLPADFAFSKYKWSVKAMDAAGANWVVGDEVLLDNLVVTKLAAESLPPSSYLLEEWTFDAEPNGTSYSGLINSAPDPYGKAEWGSDTATVYVNDGELHIAKSAGLYKAANLSQGGITEGRFELSWQWSADVEGGTQVNGATLRHTLKDLTANKELLTVAFVRQIDGFMIGAWNNVTKTHVASAALNPGGQVTNVAVRAVVDMDTDTYDLYYTSEGGSEQEIAKGVALDIAGGNMDAIRMVGFFGDKKMGPNDYFETDNLQLMGLGDVLSSEELYLAWLNEYPDVGAETEMDDNPDGDALNNLGEYAFGGDPSDGADIGHRCSAEMVRREGSDYIDYVYAARTNGVELGLSYMPEFRGNLVYGSWTNDASLYSVIGTGTAEDGFETITNRVNAEAATRFIRTHATMTP